MGLVKSHEPIFFRYVIGAVRLPMSGTEGLARLVCVETSTKPQGISDAAYRHEKTEF